jgi:hypothetical protein
METIARRASNDPEPAMQSQAMELLAHLETLQASETVDDLMFQHLEGDETVEGRQMAVPAEHVPH